MFVMVVHMIHRINTCWCSGTVWAHSERSKRPSRSSFIWWHQW